MKILSKVGLKISTIGMLIVAARRSIRLLIATRVAPLDITPHQYWMLMVLLKGAPMSLGELTRAMWMDNPTVSRMVRQMRLRGYLAVGPEPTHGRRIRIRLTPEGEAFCEQLTEIGRDFQENAQKGMSPKEITGLRAGLCKFMINLDEMVASECPGLPIHAQRGHPKPGEHPSRVSVI